MHCFWGWSFDVTKSIFKLVVGVFCSYVKLVFHFGLGLDLNLTIFPTTGVDLTLSNESSVTTDAFFIISPGFERGDTKFKAQSD